MDLSPTLVDLARERTGRVGPGRIEFRVGDMLAPALGAFDHVVSMDSLIHYAADDTMRMLAGLAARTRRGLLFTFAPRTGLLAAMHAVGQLFPRSDRSPAIEPVRERALRARVAAQPGLEGWRWARTQRVARGFYISQAVELVRA